MSFETDGTDLGDCPDCKNVALELILVYITYKGRSTEGIHLTGCRNCHKYLYENEMYSDPIKSILESQNLKEKPNKLEIMAIW